MARRTAALSMFISAKKHSTASTLPARRGIAAVNTTTGSAVLWNPGGSDGGGYVSALLVDGKTVYVGGYFDKIGGQLRSNIAALDAITGARDLISDGTRVLGVDNGHRWLTTVTGMGCMASAAIAAFIAVEPDPLVAAAAGLATLGLAAERAAAAAHGPASFKVALLDAVYGLAAEGLRAGARIVELGN